MNAAICIQVDATNPGQFFACCGLFELADRLWPDTLAWFVCENGSTTFHLQSPAMPENAPKCLIKSLLECKLTNVMTDEQLSRRKELSQKPKKDMTEEEENEKKQLDALWRELPLVLGQPFNLRLDWFTDDYAGGSTFKTWAGQQSVLDIAKSMQQMLRQRDWSDCPPSEWLIRSGGTGVGFNFDAAVGLQASALDVGFSPDALKFGVQIRPLTELAAFLGLQRFRPCSASNDNRHAYTLWTTPLLPEAAAAVVAGVWHQPDWPHYEFRLLYRTKYLKSFLPATPIVVR